MLQSALVVKTMTDVKATQTKRRKKTTTTTSILICFLSCIFFRYLSRLLRFNNEYFVVYGKSNESAIINSDFLRLNCFLFDFCEFIFSQKSSFSFCFIRINYKYYAKLNLINVAKNKKKKE